ncbi:enoyl-CoA hydratase/isomerase family protein [Sphingobium estronivorans]|uniref:enoyl-CoA hydratase/isomerase family protein n=1 Tax=Sphingobium estronivorans TaxID=1577690 RepID=UPI00123A3ED3|nr:enoyl-CoA hydratase-related protein [Sphingobium estronivorans]
MSRSFETLDYAVRDGIAVLTLDREARHNAVNSVMNRELPMAWQQVEADPDVRVAIVTGRGTKAFCTGADLGDLPQTDDRLDSIRWTAAQNRVTKPVIAAINGMAIGGGLHFPADADIVLAADHATFFDSHVAVGLVAALEPIAMARRMPIGAVLKMALTGGRERMTAREMHRLGFVDEVLSADALMDRAFALAAMIAQNSPTAVARTKAAIWAAKELPLHQALDNGWRLIQAQNGHPDLAEGIAAFGEKRAPVWAPRGPEDL